MLPCPQGIFGDHRAGLPAPDLGQVNCSSSLNRLVHVRGNLQIPEASGPARRALSGSTRHESEQAPCPGPPPPPPPRHAFVALDTSFAPWQGSALQLSQ